MLIIKLIWHNNNYPRNKCVTHPPLTTDWMLAEMNQTDRLLQDKLEQLCKVVAGRQTAVRFASDAVEKAHAKVDNLQKSPDSLGRRRHVMRSRSLYAFRLAADAISQGDVETARRNCKKAWQARRGISGLAGPLRESSKKLATAQKLLESEIATLLVKQEELDSAQLQVEQIELQIENRRIVRVARIPRRYWSQVKIVRCRSGRIDIYYGGRGKPDGPRHGHSTINQKGELVFARSPFAKYGRRIKA